MTTHPSQEDVLVGDLDVVHEDRNLTIVEFYIAGVTSRGVARRDPVDRYDRTTGVVLATSRAFSSMAKKLEKQAMGRNKHLEDVRLDQAKKALDKAADNIAKKILDKKPEVVTIEAVKKTNGKKKSSAEKRAPKTASVAT